MEKNTGKILSVSVASYNLGDMIETNLKSFCESEVADKIEVIVTDDGSKDNTPDIVEKYVKQYPNVIKLIRKANEGPGSTVNSGIKNATGKYFRMVDGDDWVRTENLKEFIEFLENSNADVVISNFDTYNNATKEIIEVSKYNIEPYKELQFKDIYKNELTAGMWSLTFKTDIFQKNNIVLSNGFYTDLEYIVYAIRYANTVAYFNKSIYVYRVAQANQSMSISGMKKNVSHHEAVLRKLLEFYKNNEKNLSYEHREYISKKIASVIGMQLGFYLLFDISKEQKNKIKNLVETTKKDYPYLYSKLKRDKKFRLVSLCNYMLYPLISKLYIWKLNRRYK